MAPEILDVAEGAGHKIFTTGAYNLNIVGQRTIGREAGKFDGWIHLVCRDEFGEWIEKRWQCTTDPGVYWLENPMRVEGTAILVPGQYRGSHQLGMHRGKYEALVQTGNEVAVYRDNTRDKMLNPIAQTPHVGYFGINIHRASSTRRSTEVGKWSAGCQVFADPEDFAEFLAIAKIGLVEYPDRVTYTLIGD